MWYFGETAAVILLVVVGAVLPGWGFTGRWRGEPLVRMLLAVLATTTLLFVAEYAAWLAGLPQSAVLFVVAAVAAVSIQRTVRERRREGEWRLPWSGCLAWISLASLMTAAQTPIVVHGIPVSGVDWFEHHERALFFLHRLPVETMFGGSFTLAARGPLFNAGAAGFMAMVGREDYGGFQIVSTVLNTFLVIPFALLLRDLAGVRESRGLPLAVAILGLVPFFVWNTTFTWTKLYTTSLILGATFLYVRGARRGRADETAWSFVVLALAFLSHYLTLIYGALFLLHFGIMAVRKRWNPKVLVLPTLVSAILVGSWFLLLFDAFGLDGTMHANTTMKAESGRPLRILRNNLVCTFVPMSWRRSEFFAGTGVVPREYPMTVWSAGGRGKALSGEYDWTNQGTVPDIFRIIGSVALLVALGMLLMRWCFRRGGVDDRVMSRAEIASWVAFFVVALPVNLLAVRWVARLGAVTNNLHPYIVLGFVFIAAWLRRLPRFVTWPLLALGLLECAISSVRLIDLQTLLLPPDLVLGERSIATPSISASTDYVYNYREKLVRELEFLSDRFGDDTLIATVLLVALAIGVWAVLLRRGSR